MQLLKLVLTVLDVRLPVRTLARGSVVTSAAHNLPGYPIEDIAKLCNLAQDVTQQILETLLSEGRVCKVSKLWCAGFVWEAFAEEAVGLVRTYHQRYPLRSGISKEEWRTRLALPTKFVADIFAALQTEGYLEAVEQPNSDMSSELSSRSSGLIRLPGFIPDFNPLQQKQVARLIQRFQEQPSMPPSRSEAEEIADVEVVNALIEQGRLVKLGDSVLFLREFYEESINKLVEYMRAHQKLTVSEARDVLGTSRKYVLPLLERMDVLRITRRLGDERTLLESAGERAGTQSTTQIEHHA